MMNFTIEEKMTKNNWYAILEEIVKSSEITPEVKEGLTNFIDHEIALLKRKHSSSSKAGKKDAENELIRTKILEELAKQETGVQIKDLMSCDSLSGYTSQKLTALIKPLLEQDKVKKEVVKRVSFYSLN